MRVYHYGSFSLSVQLHFTINHIIGLYKGEIYVILSQASPSDLPVISKRLGNAGLQYQLLDVPQQTELLGEGAEIAHA